MLDVAQKNLKNNQFVFVSIFQYLQDASDFLKQKAEHQDLALAEMRKYREIVLKELSNTRIKLEKSLKENERLQSELESIEKKEVRFKPAPPPAPPPPPPPSLLRFLPNFKKPRSKSMSRQGLLYRWTECSADFFLK